MAWVWVTGNKASSRPGHLLEEQRWRWEGNPPASEPRVLIDVCFHCQRGTNAALLHGKLLLCASLFPLRRTSSVYLDPAVGEREQPTHLPGKGILNNCSCSEEIGSWAKLFIRGWLKLDSCIHMYVLILKTLPGLLLFLFCLLCSPLMGECFPLSCSSDSGSCTHWKYIYLSSL